jgi:hypothetical protein
MGFRSAGPTVTRIEGGKTRAHPTRPKRGQLVLSARIRPLAVAEKFSSKRTGNRCRAKELR